MYIQPGSVENSRKYCLETSIIFDTCIISPPKHQPVSLTEIIDRAERIKRKLYVTEEEAEAVEKSTRQQSNCQLWFQHRTPRITASKCTRALVGKGTRPKKALAEILHYTNQVSSDFMKDGIESEPAIISSLIACY